MLKHIVFGLILGASLSPVGRAQAASPNLDSLRFLEGKWIAHGTGQGTTSDGTYTFGRELDGHILARHSRSANCKGPADFDCEHGDLLYVYADAPGQPLKAIYFDNEGHVIHYDVSTPELTKVVFLSEAGAGPQFRLTYALSGGVMTGSFEMHMPGNGPWRPYLTWSGSKQ